MGRRSDNKSVLCLIMYHRLPDSLQPPVYDQSFMRIHVRMRTPPDRSCARRKRACREACA